VSAGAGGAATPGGTPVAGGPTGDGTGPAPEPTGTGEEPPPPTPTPDGEPEPQARTLSSTGGSVRATCTTGGLAHLLSWEPAETFQTNKVEAGPAVRARITFKSPTLDVRMLISCSGGVPSAITTQA
jgi:serine/threonine-protein kinase